jgi:hypothetical protein
VLFLGLFFLPHSVQAQLLTPADWSMLPDPEAQRFEDPYRDLRQSQFESLMALARLQITLSGATAEGERAVLHEPVAERRQRAALSTNPSLDGESIEITGYLLVAPDMEDGAMVAYLLPDRGVCMHLPPPVPNQLIRLDIDDLPEPLGPCINAAVRGRLSADENTATVPVFDDTAHLWSSWRLDVSEAITAGTLPPDDNK